MDEQQKRRNEKLVLDVMEFADVLQGKDESQLSAIKTELNEELKLEHKYLDRLELGRKAETQSPMINMLGATVASGLILGLGFPENFHGLESITTSFEAAIVATSAAFAVIAGKEALEYTFTSTDFKMAERKVNRDIEGTEAKMALLDKALDGEEIDLSAIKDVTGEKLAPTVDRLSHERNNGQTR